MNGENTFDFKQLIIDAQTPPDPVGTGQGTAVELPPLFNDKTKGPNLISSEVKEDKVSVEVAMQQHTKVFTLWRPWESCKRCQVALDIDETLLPDDGDYTCPHVQTEEYKKTVDLCLRGDAVLTAKEMFNLPNGSRCVHVEWLVADEASVRKLKKQMEAKKANSVYPPDVEGAFKK
jgi:hypothetical protein